MRHAHQTLKSYCAVEPKPRARGNVARVRAYPYLYLRLAVHLVSCPTQAVVPKHHQRPKKQPAPKVVEKEKKTEVMAEPEPQNDDVCFSAFLSISG